MALRHIREEGEEILRKRKNEVLKKAHMYYLSIGKSMDHITEFPGEDQGYEKQYLANKKRSF